MVEQISLVEFYDQLAEYALGWLGWSEEQTLAADVNAIIIGMHGRWDMLKAMFGSDEAASEPADLPEAAAGILSKS